MMAILKLIPFKVWLAIVLGIGAVIFGYGEYKDNLGYDRAMKECMEAPKDTVTRVEYLTTTIRDTVFKKIYGTIRDTVDLSWATRQQLEEAAMPFEISQPVTVTDDNEKVGISFDLSLTAQPIGHSITGLRFSNIRSSYPKETIEITKTVVEPYRQNLCDLFVESKFGGVFGVKGVAGYLQSGLEFNIGAVQLSCGLGAASQNKKLHGLWTAGIRVSTR